MVAISIGIAVFISRNRVRMLQIRMSVRATLNTAYTWVLKTIDRGAFWATRLQQGKLRSYLVIMLAGAIALDIGFQGLSLAPDLSGLFWPSFNLNSEIEILRLFVIFLIASAALASVLLRSDFSAILAVGASGLGMAVLMIMASAPDVALVQVVVDILMVVILMLALTRLPRRQRQKVRDVTFRQSPVNLMRDILIATAIGVIVMLIALESLLSRPRLSVVTPYFEANAKKLTGAADIVGAIIVDFRALDTLIEITVFAMAGLGIYTLLRYAARKHGDTGRQVDELPASASRRLTTFGIGGTQTSSLLHALAYVSLPIAILIGTLHMMYGHDFPGDGFTAGVIIGLAVGFWYVVFGYYEMQQHLRWLKASVFISAGILLAIVTGTVAAIFNGSFFSNVDFGAMLGLPLPKGFHVSTSFLFELSICLTVLGSIAHMLNTLGHPGEKDAESTRRLSGIIRQEKR
jgi:multicomponent K+:H+ antiporter subunit A